MDSFEFNKIAGVTLGACLFAMSVGIFTGAVFDKPVPKNLGWTPPGLDLPAAGGGGPAAPAVDPIGLRLASADAAKGETAFKRNCASCHSLTPGGAVEGKAGPNLHNVVGRKVGSMGGYAYSDGVKGHGGDWTYEDLDHWIDNPRKTIPGNKMSYAGDKNPAGRADLIAYLRTQTENPPPLPAAEAKAPDAPKADAPKADAPKH